MLGSAFGGQKPWEIHRKPGNASGDRNPGKPAESTILFLGAETLETHLYYVQVVLVAIGDKMVQESGCLSMLFLTCLSLLYA